MAKNSQPLFKFPEEFETGELTNTDPRYLCAIALCAWGCCMAGETPPENLGATMLKIKKYIGFTPNPYKLQIYADLIGPDIEK